MGGNTSGLNNDINKFFNNSKNELENGVKDKIREINDASTYEMITLNLYHQR